MARSGVGVKPLAFSYDREHDVLTIEGMRYTGTLFRVFAEGGLAIGKALQIIHRQDGILTIKELDRPLSKLLRLWRQERASSLEVSKALDELLEAYDR